MRQIGTIADEAEARQLADYLLTLDITTRIDETPGGWAVWVHREDLVPKAREEFHAFLSDPDDAKYRDATTRARQIRKEAERAERAHRRNTRDIREEAWGQPSIKRCPLTAALIGLSIALTLLANFGKNRAVVFPLLFASPRAVLVVGEDWMASEPGGDVRVGFDPLADLRRGEIWRPITPIFLHGSILHILFNMYWMLLLGVMIETRLGTRKLALIVLISALASNLGQYLYTGSPFFYGMSGVVLALFGYIWMKGMYEPERGLGLPPFTIFIMLLFVGYTTFFAVPGTSIAIGAHLVGLVVGVLLGVGPYLLGSRRDE